MYTKIITCNIISGAPHVTYYVGFRNYYKFEPYEINFNIKEKQNHENELEEQ